MIRHKEVYTSDFTLEQIYNVIIDVESYPEFLPWLSSATIIERNEGFFVADLEISFKGFREHYRSKVSYTYDKEEAHIEVALISGPFKHLHTEWRLNLEKQKVKIDFSIDFQFKTIILDKLIGMMFQKVCKKMLNAFIKRAEQLYE